MTSQSKNQPPTKNQKPVKLPSEAQCLNCNGKGHCKRECPKYLEDKKNGCASCSG